MTKCYIYLGTENPEDACILSKGGKGGRWGSVFTTTLTLLGGGK